MFSRAALAISRTHSARRTFARQLSTASNASGLSTTTIGAAAGFVLLLGAGGVYASQDKKSDEASINVSKVEVSPAENAPVENEPSSKADAAASGVVATSAEALAESIGVHAPNSDSCTGEVLAAILARLGDPTLSELEKRLWKELAVQKNSAFVFVKPHAVNPLVVDTVRAGLFAAGISVRSEGAIDASAIDQGSLIDTHYGAIASKAVELQPCELSVPDKGKAAFEAAFGMSWDDALAQGKVYNAADACKKLGVDADGLDTKWGQLKRGEDMIKFGGGFYCGKLSDDIFAINGFYMSMRGKYTANDSSGIHYFVVLSSPPSPNEHLFDQWVLGSYVRGLKTVRLFEQVIDWDPAALS